MLKEIRAATKEAFESDLLKAALIGACIARATPMQNAII